MNILLLFTLALGAFEELNKIEVELNDIAKVLNDSSTVLSHIIKKTHDMSREIRLVSSKSNRLVSKLQKSVDVAVYSMFNSEIERKYKALQYQYKIINKNVAAGSVTKRIGKIVDHFVKRQKIPDAEMHQSLVQLEHKIGELAKVIKDSYNLDWLYLSLIVIGIVLVIIWKNINYGQKKHLL